MFCILKSDFSPGPLNRSTAGIRMRPICSSTPSSAYNNCSGTIFRSAENILGQPLARRLATVFSIPRALQFRSPPGDAGIPRNGNLYFDHADNSQFVFTNAAAAAAAPSRGRRPFQPIKRMAAKTLWNTKRDREKNSEILVRPLVLCTGCPICSWT